MGTWTAFVSKPLLRKQDYQEIDSIEEKLKQPISTTLASYEEHTGEPEAEITFESFYELKKPNIIHEDWKVELNGTSSEKAVEAIKDEEE